MALATAPRLFLLDEPVAGMGPDESARMIGLSVISSGSRPYG
jgi:branched-chain amino acid transport system ATP-binding protein